MKIRRWGRRVHRTKTVEPFAAPSPRPSRVNDRVVFHSDGWHYGPCSWLTTADDCVLPRRTDVLVRNAVFDSGLTLVVDEPDTTDNTKEHV